MNVEQMLGFTPFPTPVLKLTLSRRNLLALLHGLEEAEDEGKDETGPITRQTEQGILLALFAETDERHYKERAEAGYGPGMMPENTEAFILRDEIDRMEKKQAKEAGEAPSGE